MQEAEQRVFSCGEKRAFDMALQEMLNQATIEVKIIRGFEFCGSVLTKFSSD